MNITTKDEFDQAVKTGRTIVKFTAEWCKPCKAMEPTLFQLQLQDNLKVVTVDVEASPALAEAYGVQGLPLLAYYVDGVCEGHLQGSKSRREIETAFRL
jgi:thioredoxin 1